MRIYTSATEMLDETYREIWKRGQTIWDKTVQGKQVGEKDYEQKEVVFYNFRVDDYSDNRAMLDKARATFGKKHLRYEVACQWFEDMLYNNTLHEKWWDMTPDTQDYFKKFCDEGDGFASYSYGERMMPQINYVIKRLAQNKYSRGAIISMFKLDDVSRIGRRIPCTVSYHFMVRPTTKGDKLNLLVNMRSADAINFFPLDFVKATMLLDYVGEKLVIPVGYIMMSIDSLHVYKLDVPNTYQW